MKICASCQENLPITIFGKNKRCSDGLAVYCKPCFSIIRKRNESKNRHSAKCKKSRAKAWKKYASKPEVKERRQLLRKNYKNRENSQKKHRRTTDHMFRIKGYLRGRLLMALKSKKWFKNSSFSKYFGCSKDVFIQFFEDKFQPGMTWENHGYYGWHIDHIIPLSSATSEEELYKLCHYTNLQPLWADDNFKKSNK